MTAIGGLTGTLKKIYVISIGIYYRKKVGVTG